MNHSSDIFVNGGTPVVYSIFRDHLGTITEIRNSNDGTIQEYSFDAWGRRRKPSDWSNYDTSDEPPLFANRGFTGHVQ
ncbi:hypothetical protein [Roseimarinus sediminis]|uniref:hypothetical protein n=1 Tax=Roseimarinus sediminis TaxID=1610899 RepID=UPI003D1BE4EE